MYLLLVYFADDSTPRARINVQRAADVLTRIPAIMAEHHGCEHVVVFFGGMRLFGVNCAGNAVD